MKDIHDEIDERKRYLVDKIAEGKSKGKEITECELTVVRRSQVVDSHLEKLDHEINAAFSEEMKKLNDDKEIKAAKINMEADGEIAKITAQINKRRYERLQENDEDSKRKIQTTEEEMGVLNRDLKHIKEKFRHESDLQNTKWQQLSKALDEALMKADNLVNEEKDLFIEFKHVMQSLDQGLEAEINVENVRYISSIIEKILFRREDGQAFGRLGVPSNEWEKGDEIDTVLWIRLCAIGSVKNGEVVFRDVYDGAIYVKNIREKTSRKVVVGRNLYNIYSCTSLDDGRIVCGTTNSEIVIYDPMWKHITGTIVLTNERKGKVTWVTTDRYGVIVAVVSGSATIYVYNPDDGSLMRSVTIDSGPIHGIGCLSSGDTAVSTNYCSQGNDVCVVDRSGVVKSTTHYHGKTVRSIAVDKFADLTYVMYNVGSKCSVDVLSPNGKLAAL